MKNIKNLLIQFLVGVGIGGIIEAIASLYLGGDFVGYPEFLARVNPGTGRIIQVLIYGGFGLIPELSSIILKLREEYSSEGITPERAEVLKATAKKLKEYIVTGVVKKVSCDKIEKYVPGDIGSESVAADKDVAVIDVGTKTEIQKLVVKLANEGMSVVFISSEVEEMLRTVTHMGILRDGEKVGELEESELSQENVMKAIAGGDK